MAGLSGVAFLFSFGVMIGSVVTLQNLQFPSMKGGNQLPSVLKSFTSPQNALEGMGGMAAGVGQTAGSALQGMGGMAAGVGQTAGSLASTATDTAYKMAQDPTNALSHANSGLVAGTSDLFGAPLQVMIKNVLQGVQDALTLFFKNLVDRMPENMKQCVVRIITNIEGLLINTPVVGPALSGNMQGERRDLINEGSQYGSDLYQ